MRKILNILVILLFIGVFLTAGCTQGTPSTNTVKSDDDLYLKSLDDFFLDYISIASKYKSASQLSDHQRFAADLKSLTITYQDRVSALTVSPKFELSRNSFLQAMKELESTADYMLSTTYGKSVLDMSPSEKALQDEDQRHIKNFGLFLTNTYDSNVCLAAGDKYLNITNGCKEISKTTK